MKICMLTNTYLPHVGGVARSVSQFAKDLRRMGHGVLIVAPVFPDYERHDAGESDILRVPAIQQVNGSDFSVRIPLPFVVNDEIDRFGPDIIHSHHPYFLGDAALRAARRRQLPLIFTHHTLYEKYTHYISRNPGAMKRLAAFMSTNYANLCDRVVAPSGSIRKLLRDRGVDAPITEIPTGVDINFFSRGDGKAFRRRHDIPPEDFLIGHLGRLAPEKNLAYLAAAAARSMRSQSGTRFLVVGEGPSEPAIRAIFRDAGLAGRLVMTGKMTGRQLVDAYHAMDLFVFASTSETQGMVLTEAMAAGVPVIALDAPGAREVVADGENGRLLEGSASERRFAGAVSEAVDAPERLDAWRRAARRTAARFDRLESSRKLTALYAGAIEDRLDRRESRSLDAWDRFLLACRAEWELAAQKTESVIQTVDEDETIVGVDDAEPGRPNVR